MRRIERVQDVLCPDHVKRTAWIVGENDTFFTTPAAVQVRGKTVSGFITKDEDGYKFSPYLRNKNALVFPQVAYYTLPIYGQPYDLAPYRLGEGTPCRHCGMPTWTRIPVSSYLEPYVDSIACCSECQARHYSPLALPRSI